MKIADTVREYYSSTIWDYSKAWSLEYMHLGLYLRENETFEESLKNTVKVGIRFGRFKPGDLILDAGCGTGGTLRYLRKYGIKGVGISIVPEHLKIAKSREDLPYFIMDYHNTGFRENTFDGIIAIESFCYAKPKSKFIQECYRILKPGKRLVIIDGYLKKDTKIYRMWKKCWAVPDLPTPENVLTLMKNCGFYPNFIDLTRYAAKSSRILFMRSLIFPLVYVLYRFGKFREWQYRNCLGGFLQYFTHLTNSCGYGIWIGTRR